PVPQLRFIWPWRAPRAVLLAAFRGAPMQGQGFQATAEGGRASLDLRTQLPSDGCWGLNVWPEAGEAVIFYRPVGGGASGDEGTAWSRLPDEVRESANHA